MHENDTKPQATTDQPPRQTRDGGATTAPASGKKPYAAPKFFRHNPLDSVSSSYYYYYTY